MLTAVSIRDTGEPSAAAPARMAARVKLHHVYYMLALFSVAAVCIGLFLTHHIGSLFSRSIEHAVEWSKFQRNISEVRRAALIANAPGNDLFVTKDLDAEIGKLDKLSDDLQYKIEQLSEAATKGLPKENMEGADAFVARIREAADRVSLTSLDVFDLFRRGQIEAASAAMSIMDRQTGILISEIDRLEDYLLTLRLKQRQAEAALVAGLQKCEFVLGGMIFLIVVGVTGFGHRLGRKLQAQYDALEAANTRQRELVANLQDSHADIVSLNAELEYLNSDLEQRVADRTAELEDANSSITKLNVELAKSLKALKDAQDEALRRRQMVQLGQLTATVAHEIRNPLGSVRTATFLIERKVADLNLGLEKAFERINGGIKRCDTVITELLNFASSKLPALSTVDVDEWVGECLDAEAETLPPMVRIERSLSAGRAIADVDPDRMRRVISNLLRNASEAMVGNGEVLDTRSGDTPTIWVSTASDGETVRITVRDNGPGIPAEHLKLILEPLFTTKSFGVGLGLTAAEQILRLHGGGLEIDSRPGEGATFVAWFPLHQADLKAA